MTTGHGATGTATTIAATAGRSSTATAGTPASSAPAARERADSRPARALLPLVLDVGVPLGSYYLLHTGLGVGTVPALAAASVVPALRTLVTLARRRTVERLALLILALNVAGIATSFLTGSARLMMAKDSVLSSVVGAGILLSVWRGAPVMTAGLKPYLTKGRRAREEAWQRLAAGSAQFRRLERRYSVIWGVMLLADSLARIAGALLLPVSTMVWLSTVLVIAAITIAAVVGGGAAVEPMQRLIAADIRPTADTAPTAETGE